MADCLVYSEAESKCLLCEEGFVEDGAGGCEKVPTVVGVGVGGNNISVVLVNTDPLLAKADKTQTLSLSPDDKK